MATRNQNIHVYVAVALSVFMQSTAFAEDSSGQENSNQATSARAKATSARSKDTSVPSKKGTVVVKAPVTSSCAASFGKGFVEVGDTGFCGRGAINVLGWADKDGANKDILFYGVRLPTASNLSPNLPMLYYVLHDYSSQTKGLGLGVDAMANYLVAKETDLGILTGFVNIRGLGQLQLSGEEGWGKFTFDQSRRPFWITPIDQAWVRLTAGESSQLHVLQAGVQPSLFGFNRLGYSVMPGYTSVITTPSISYIQNFANKWSWGIAAEDPTRRQYADGVLASYDNPRLPDFVGQLRIGSPSFLFHASAAAHEIRDKAANDCCSKPIGSTWGWAASVGGEYRLKWSDVFGDAAGQTYGKFMVSAAAAQGALAYLGIPFMATDYVAEPDGSIVKSKGQSLVVAYEHLWSLFLKSSVTYSAFHTHMNSNAQEFIPDTLLSFASSVRGSRLTVGTEYMMQPGLMVGAEGSYTWTKAQVNYGVVGSGYPLNANFPAVYLYVRKMWTS